MSLNKGVIDGIDFYDGFEAQRYWSFPASYSQEKKTQELNTMLYSNTYLASEKKDGYFERIIKDMNGDVFMCSRSKGVNGVVEKSAWVPHLNPFFDALPNGTVLLGEVYLPNKTSKGIVSILGCGKDKAISRQAKDENKLRLWLFDILAYDGELLYKLPIRQRTVALSKLASLGEDLTPFVDIATYWDTPDEIHENWLSIIAQGGEGIVLTHKDYPYEFKKRTARKTLKLKKELQETIDVFLTGKHLPPTFRYQGSELDTWQYWYDEVSEERVLGTPGERVAVGHSLTPVTRLWYHNMAGSIEIAVLKGDKEVPIGWISTIPDDVRKGIVDDPGSLRGSVIEIQAMEIDRSGSMPTLRHAKISRWRDDKRPSECTWEQLL